MNYRHAFHAGNFADVFKHAVLARILVYLTRKEAPLRYLDTHAGSGLYDLAAARPRAPANGAPGSAGSRARIFPPMSRRCWRLISPSSAPATPRAGRRSIRDRRSSPSICCAARTG